MRHSTICKESPSAFAKLRREIPRADVSLYQDGHRALKSLSCNELRCANKDGDSAAAMAQDVLAISGRPLISVMVGKEIVIGRNPAA